MEYIEKLQNLMQKFSKITYEGIYLWKYLQYELIAGIKPESHMFENNSTLCQESSDLIPDASQAQINSMKRLLENLSEKEILFGMIPLRRFYQGKYEHTAMDSYVLSIDRDKYTVLEPDSGRLEDDDENICTKNRIRFSPLGVIGCYGQDKVDINGLLAFLLEAYVYPIERTFQIKIPRKILINSACKASTILKERRAYVTFFDEVIKRINPKVVCYTHGPDNILCFLYEAAQRRGIPTVEIEHGAIIRNFIYPKELSYSDYYLTQSELLTKPMIERGIQNVYTIGKPGIYSASQPEKSEDQPIVISFISSMEPDMYMQAQALAKRLDKQKYIVVYKLHSIEQHSEEEIARVMAENENWQFLDGTVDVRDLYAFSDIVIGMRSTGILDALPFCKIKILVLKDMHEKEMLVGNQSFFYELDKMGDIIYIDHEEKLYEEVTHFKRGQDYRSKENHYWPKDSDTRFREFMRSFTEGKRP